MSGGGGGGEEFPPLASLTRIGGGKSADVYDLGDGRLLKVFRDHADPRVAAREAAAAGLAIAAGARAATPLAVIEAEGRPALVLGRLDGATALAAMRGSPRRIMRGLRDLARYQARMHAAVVAEGGLPDLDVVVAARIGWSAADEATTDAATRALAAVPRGDRLCHGDLHPANLLVTPAGPAAIDWSLATRGDPAGDVARTELLLRFASYGPRLRRWRALRVTRWLSGWWYRRCYARASGIAARAVDAWHLPIAVAWLQPGSVAYAPALRRFIAVELRKSSPARGRWQP